MYDRGIKASSSIPLPGATKDKRTKEQKDQRSEDEVPKPRVS